MDVEIRPPRTATRDEIKDVIEQLDEKYCINRYTSYVKEGDRKVTVDQFLKDRSQDPNTSNCQ